MNVTQWTALIRSDMPWQKRNVEIARVVKEHLDATDHMDNCALGEELSSKELVEQLMPVVLCRGEQIEARNDLFRLLFKLAKNELRDYCHKSDEEKKMRYGKIQPWVWHANRKPVDTCPHCGGVLS